MTKTERLYGVKISHFDDMIGAEQFYERKTLVDAMIMILHRPKYLHRDDVRIRDVFKAQRWVDSIIEEIEDKG